MNIRTISIGGIIIVGVIALAVGLRMMAPHSPADTNKLQVTTTFYPLAYLAQRIGGDLVQVTNLTPAGSEPHDFDPAPQDIVQLHRSGVFVYNGAGLEPWVDRVIPELEQEGVTIVNATSSLSLLPAPDHSEGTVDPHVWLDPVLYAKQAEAIARALSERDSAHADVYNANAQALQSDLETLNQEFVSGLTSCKTHTIVTSHAAFQYLAKRYGLSMVSIAGLSPDEEPSPARMAEIAQFVHDQGVGYIFFESLVSPRLSETIAQETGATTIAFNPLEGLSKEEMAHGDTYISVQQENLHALQVALGCL